MDLADQSVLASIGLWLHDTLFLPGDYVLSVLGESAPSVVHLLERSPIYHRGSVSGLISAATWVGATILIKKIYGLARDLAGIVTAQIKGLYLGPLRRGRNAKRRLAIAFRAREVRRAVPGAGHAISEEIELDELQLATLRCHADLAAGSMLTARDVASAIGVRPYQAQRALDALRKLHLLDNAFGTSDEEGGYRLTQLGLAFLAAYIRTTGRQH